jgi:hypothetical protein
VAYARCQAAEPILIVFAAPPPSPPVPFSLPPSLQVDQGLNVQVPLPGGRKLGFSGGLYNRIVASATHFMQVRRETHITTVTHGVLDSRVDPADIHGNACLWSGGM